MTPGGAPHPLPRTVGVASLPGAMVCPLPPALLTRLGARSHPRLGRGGPGDPAWLWAPLWASIQPCPPSRAGASGRLTRGASWLRSASGIWQPQSWKGQTSDHLGASQVTPGCECSGQSEAPLSDAGGPIRPAPPTAPPASRGSESAAFGVGPEASPSHPRESDCALPTLGTLPWPHLPEHEPEVTACHPATPCILSFLIPTSGSGLRAQVP